jgi:Flp pilus assembly protein TadD
VERWTEATKRFPKYPKSHIMRAKALMAAGQGEAAGVVIDLALQQFPGHVGVALQHAYNAKHASDWPLAAQRFRHVVALFPDNLEAANQLEICLRKLETRQVEGQSNGADNDGMAGS